MLLKLLLSAAQPHILLSTTRLDWISRNKFNMAASGSSAGHLIALLHEDNEQLQVFWGIIVCFFAFVFFTCLFWQDMVFNDYDRCTALTHAITGICSPKAPRKGGCILGRNFRGGAILASTFPPSTQTHTHTHVIGRMHPNPYKPDLPNRYLWSKNSPSSPPSHLET